MLFNFPNEIFEQIIEYVSCGRTKYTDLKSLILTCKSMLPAIQHIIKDVKIDKLYKNTCACVIYCACGAKLRENGLKHTEYSEELMDWFNKKYAYYCNEKCAYKYIKELANTKVGDVCKCTGMREIKHGRVDFCLVCDKPNPNFQYYRYMIKFDD